MGKNKIGFLDSWWLFWHGYCEIHLEKWDADMECPTCKEEGRVKKHEKYLKRAAKQEVNEARVQKMRDRK